MTIKATVEFYDQHGLILHSGWYHHIRQFESPDLEEARQCMRGALTVFGMLYEEAKTVTLRCDVPGNLFPVTLECLNPHHKSRAADLDQ